MAEWWLDSGGNNLLKGVPGDADNPPVLEDALIVAFLQEQPEARNSFNRLVPTMLQDEQLRLMTFTEGEPTLTSIIHDRIGDSFQHRLNTQKIRTSGPSGGGNWAPPPMKG